MHQTCASPRIVSRYAPEEAAAFLAGVTGTYQDPEGYFADEAEAERFDAQFPPREKLRLPGQLF